MLLSIALNFTLHIVPTFWYSVPIFLFWVPKFWYYMLKSGSTNLSSHQHNYSVPGSVCSYWAASKSHQCAWQSLWIKMNMQQQMGKIDSQSLTYDSSTYLTGLRTWRGVNYVVQLVLTGNHRKHIRNLSMIQFLTLYLVSK